MSASSSAMRSGRYAPRVGRRRCLPSARSHALKRSRCLTDRITEGLALAKSISQRSAEFDDVTGRNAAGRAVKKIAIDNGAKLRRRQHIITPHQIPDFKTAVFADRLQRS